MKATLLLVTWLVAGQAPDSYQAQFSSSEACESARAAIIKDAARVLNQLSLPRTTPSSPPGFRTEGDRTPLVVSALCVSTGAD
jgi:hypothetical protein